MEELINNARELNWGYIMSTLVIRFVGVFIVLAILMIGMQILGAVVSRLVAGSEERAARKREQEAPAVAMEEAAETETADEEMVAAIGAAIAVAMESETKAASILADTGVTADPWAVTGRVAMMNARLQGGSHREP